MSGCLTEDVCDGVAEVDVVVDDCGVDDDADIADAETGADGAGLLDYSSFHHSYNSHQNFFSDKGGMRVGNGDGRELLAGLGCSRARTVRPT